VLSVSASPAAGDWGVGNTLTLMLDLSEAVTSRAGTPTLSLNDGGTASYAYQNVLVFYYTVAAGQNTNSLAATAVNLNGATIKDGSGNAANLSLSGLIQAGPQIDTTGTPQPVTTSPTVASVVTSGSGITAGNRGSCGGQCGDADRQHEQHSDGRRWEPDAHPQ
jgi:hypothetical protein